MGTIVFGAICPHGPIAVTETCTDDELELAAATREAFEELGRRAAAAEPDAVVVVTPHNVHVQGAMAVVVAGALEGAVAGTDGRTIGLEAATDRELAGLVLEALHDAGVPTVGVSYGGNRDRRGGDADGLGHADPALAPRRACDTSAARRRRQPGARSLARSARRRGPRDRGRRRPLRPPRRRSSRAPTTGTATTRTGRTATTLRPPSTTARSRRSSERTASAELLALEPAFVERAAADSWWQLLMLHGALGDGWQAELLSYEAPTYYGMLCAAFTPS